MTATTPRKSRPANDRDPRILEASPTTSRLATVLGGACSSALLLDEVEAVAQIGSYSLDVASGRWTSSRGLDAILGIDGAFVRSVEGWASLIHPADCDAMVAYLAEDVLGRGESFDRQYRIVRPDSGEERWVHGRGTLALDPSGRPVRMLGTIADITDRRRAEASRGRMSELVERAVEIAGVGAWELDLRTMRLVWSPETYRIHEVDPAVVPRLEQAIDFYAPEARPVIRAAVQAAINAGTPFDLDLPLTTAKGRAIWVRSQGSATMEGGKAILVHGTVQDVTERKRAEQELRESEARTRDLIEGSGDGILVSDVSGRYVEANPAICRMLGYSRDELLAMRAGDLTAADDPVGNEGMDRRLAAARAEAGILVERRYRRHDGTSLPVEVRFTVLPDGRQQRNVREISVRVDAEVRYRGLLEAAPDAMVVVDQGGDIVLLNVQAEKQFGYLRDELIGQPVTNIIPEGFAERLVADDLRSDEDALAQQIGTGIELSARRKDGTEFPIEIMLSPLRSAEGILVTAAIRDISVRKEAEAEISSLNEGLEQRVAERTAELEAANKELESFSYSVSHDLRAPLRAISGFAAILGRRYWERLDDKGRHYIDTIVASSDHMGILIDELLDYSRLGRGAVRAEPVPLEPLVAALRIIFGERLAVAGGTFEVIEPLATPVGDPMLIEQILVNLVDNALTYRRPGVVLRVTLSASRRGRKVTIAVADNGIGIPEAYRQRVFEVFARLHSDEEYPGTGIGLSIVRKAARRIGSDITLESIEGVGSTFSLTLPAAEGSTKNP